MVAREDQGRAVAQVGIDDAVGMFDVGELLVQRCIGPACPIRHGSTPLGAYWTRVALRWFSQNSLRVCCTLRSDVRPTRRCAERIRVRKRGDAGAFCFMRIEVHARSE